jgi:helicase required for RNAi-mediated heterochromatin assembly 1
MLTFQVYIRGFTFARAGVAARITFSTVRAGCKINWQSSSRLISGSILALTPAKDKFRTKCIIAIVAARPKAGVECNPPEIDIYFSRAEDAEIDPQVEWLMIEAKKGFYESMRYTMQALQKMSGET